MSQLCHCKAALHQVSFRGAEPLIVMPFCTKELDSTTPEPPTVKKKLKQIFK